MFHERTKHIDLRYHFVSDIVARGDLCIKKISTHANPADMLTKPLSQDKLELLQKHIGLQHSYSRINGVVFYFILSNVCLGVSVFFEI